MVHRVRITRGDDAGHLAADPVRVASVVALVAAVKRDTRTRALAQQLMFEQCAPEDHSPELLRLFALAIRRERAECLRAVQSWSASCCG